MDLFKLLKKHYGDTAMFHTVVGAYYDELSDLRNRKIKKLLEYEYQLETLGDSYKEMKLLEQSYKEQIKIKTAKAHNNLYCWITINPKPSVTFQDFKKIIEKIVKRTIFTDYLYVYEQRGVDMETLGSGFHSHILATRNLNYKPSKVARNVRNSCKKLVGDINSNNQVNIQFIGEEYAADKKEYILGLKTGEGKDIKQQMDIIWRQKENLNVYYNAQKAQGNTSQDAALQGADKTPAEIC